MRFISRCIPVFVLALIAPSLAAQQICDKSGQPPCLNQPHPGDKQITGKLSLDADKMVAEGTTIIVTVNKNNLGPADINLSDGVFAKTVEPLKVSDMVAARASKGADAIATISVEVVAMPAPAASDSSQQICDKAAPAQTPCVNQPHAGDTHISGKLPLGDDKRVPGDVTIEVTINDSKKGNGGAADIDRSNGTFTKSVDALSIYDSIVITQPKGSMIVIKAPLTVKVAPPTPVAENADFDLVLGVGSLIVKGDVTDYKTNSQNSALQTTNLGRATPQLLAGAAFKLPFGNFTKRAGARVGTAPWYAFLSLKFSPNSSQTFSGYVIGGSYKLSKAFSILAGYALTPLQEPSPGFRVAAAQIVRQNPNFSCISEI